LEKEKLTRITYLTPALDVVFFGCSDVVTASGEELSWSTPDKDDGGWT